MALIRWGGSVDCMSSVSLRTHCFFRQFFKEWGKGCRVEGELEDFDLVNCFLSNVLQLSP